MNESSPLRICLVGLPATGKTTFIAALWGFLTSGPADSSFQVVDYPDDPKYLNQITAAWAAGTAMPRNSLGATDRIEFTIESAGGPSITLVLPDLPGEVFQNAILRPMIEEEVAQAVTGSDLLLLFVNGENARTFTALGDFDVPMDAAPEDSSSKATEASDSPVVLKEFSIRDLDSDTLNTELLQRLDQLAIDRPPCPIAVVVSAWDVHHSDGDTPLQWLEREQPMFAQLLAEFSRRTAVGVLGVSAQGGNYDDNPEIKRKLATERPWACDEDGIVTDIAGPLIWYQALKQPSS